ncbi:MAG TPA: DUF1064 domain-containing protein [Methanospirillum sp.]|nr:DUF1064 domain-containing protein [Methanospirillum sp.]
MPIPKRRTRVKNATKIVINGKIFSSKAEGYYYTVLLEKLKAGEIQKIELQIPFELQPQYKKCQAHGCDFIWVRPGDEKDPNYKRYYSAKTCPKCNAPLKLHREMLYVCDFVVTDAYGKKHVIDVKSSVHFQTEVFKLKKKIFEFRYPSMLLEEVYPKIPKGWSGYVDATAEATR